MYRGSGQVHRGRSPQEIVDDLGIGQAQLRITVLGGAIYAILGDLLPLLVMLPQGVATELGLHPYQKALLASALTFGLLNGNGLNGLGDRFLGRRLPILIAYAGSLVFSLALAFVSSYYSYLTCIYLIGLSLGLGVPSLNSLISETSPRNARVASNAFAQFLFNVSCLLVLIRVWYLMPDLTDIHLYWRRILLVGRVPHAGLFLLSVYPGFLESPRWYLARGDSAKANQVFAEMRRQNGLPNVSIELDPTTVIVPKTEATVWEGLPELFGRRLRCTTLICLLSTFTINFHSYGLGYAGPVVLPQLDLGMSPAAFMIMMNLGDVVGQVLATFLRVTRKGAFCVYMFMVFVAMCVFIAGVMLEINNIRRDVSRVLEPVGLLVSNISSSMGWVVVYTYISEVYPTNVRATGGGLCIAIGKLGAISSPLVFEHMGLQTGAFLTFFFITTAMISLNGICMYLYLPETKDKALEDRLDEATPFASRRHLSEAEPPWTTAGDARPWSSGRQAYA